MDKEIQGARRGRAVQDTRRAGGSQGMLRERGQAEGRIEKRAVLLQEIKQSSYTSGHLSAVRKSPEALT